MFLFTLLLEDMEKLIELVYYYNSHLEKGKIWIWLTTSVKEDGREVPFDKEKEIRKYENYIISKKYGFIERLVENDKIEWSEKTAFVTFLEREINADKSDALVSLLAVKDNPIDYLCSILKE